MTPYFVGDWFWSAINSISLLLVAGVVSRPTSRSPYHFGPGFSGR